MVVHVEAPVNIFGDVHGQLFDLIAHFDKVGWPEQAQKHNFLFLGDYVDRGRHSIETISLLLAFMIKYSGRITLLRGNHECASINRIYGFYDDCKRRYSIKLWKSFTDCFEWLPVAAVVANKIFCVHGGLSPRLQTLQQLESLERPADPDDTPILSDVLWSDPDRVSLEFCAFLSSF